MATPRINQQSLPHRVMVDTIVLTMSLGDRPHDQNADICRTFWEAAVAGCDRVLIPSPCVAEMLRADNPTHVPRHHKVQVVPFDNASAQILGERLPHRILANSMNNGFRKHYIKYDALILASAIRYSATLVTYDKLLIELGAAADHKVCRPDSFLDLPSKAELAAPKP